MQGDTAPLAPKTMLRMTTAEAQAVTRCPDWSPRAHSSHLSSQAPVRARPRALPPRRKEPPRLARWAEPHSLPLQLARLRSLVRPSPHPPEPAFLPAPDQPPVLSAANRANHR